MSAFFAVSSQSFAGDIVLLLVRVLVGVAFILHGWSKMQNPTGWMGTNSPIPGFLQVVSAIAEVGGGLLLIAGLLTRLGALGIFIDMIVASYMHFFVWHHPFISDKGPSAEPALDYLILALLILVFGPGSISLDRMIFGAK